MSVGVAQAGTIGRPHVKVCESEDVVRNLIQVRVDFGLEEFIRAFEVFSDQKLMHDYLSDDFKTVIARKAAGYPFLYYEQNCNFR